MSGLLVRSKRLVLPDGIRAGVIHIRDGRVVAIGAYDDCVAGVDELDAGELVVLPGLVDTHVHINDPGRSDWEGFDSATRAAAAGGITTLVDMPLNSIPPTTTAAGLEAKRRAAEGRCAVDVAFWGGVVPGNHKALEALARAGVRGFKCFLSPSGVDEFAHVTEDDLREAMPMLARLKLPLLAHAEWPALLHDPSADPGNPRKYQTWLQSRPAASEQAAIDLLIQLAREFGARVHIVHLATPDALSAITAARRSGVALTVETCPHYLTFSAEEIPDGATAFKCAPPIRERQLREGLWAGLSEGEIDCIATDHSPAPPALKRLDDGDFVRAWGGIASLQIALPVVWSGMLARGLSMTHLPRWLAANPATLAGLQNRKGSIAEGCDADLVIWDPDVVTTVDAASLYHRHPVTPYHGARLHGRVQTTILRGRVIFNDGEVLGASGRLI
ncbi:MAG: allantoinase AllB [Vicinamibacterales bacterium]